MCPRTCRCATGWTRMARPPRARTRWRVRASRSQRAGGARTKASSASSAEFTDRTGITVEFTPDEARTLLDSRARRTRPPPGRVRRRRDPGMGRRPRAGHRPVRRPRHAAIGLRRVPARAPERDGEGRRRTARGRPSSGDSARRRPEGPRVLSRRPSSAKPGTRSRTRGTSSSRCLIRSRLTGARRGASPSSPATAPAGPVPTSSRVWCIRAGGVDTYDAWTTGEIGFTSPAVMEAGRLADDLIFEPGFVRGGPATISEQWYYEPIQLHARASTKRPARPNRGAGCSTRPTSCLQVRSSRTASSVRTSTSSCSRRSIRISRLPRSEPRPFAIGAGRHARGSGLHGVRRQSGVG